MARAMGKGMKNPPLPGGWSLLGSDVKDPSWHVLPHLQPHFILCCKRNAAETKPPTPEHPSAPGENRAAQQITTHQHGVRTELPNRQGDISSSDLIS